MGHGAAVRPNELKAPVCCIQKTSGQIIPQAVEGLDGFRANPDDIALIGFALAHLWPVDILIIGQQNISWPQLIGTPLNHIGDSAGQEEINLIKLVFVKLHFRRNLV